MGNSSYDNKENTITTTPRVQRTTPVALFRVLGDALFAKIAAVLAHRKVKTTHKANTVRSGLLPIAK